MNGHTPDKINDLDSFKTFWKGLEDCCLKHPKDFQLDDVVEVLHWSFEGYDEAWNDSSSMAIARLRDGKFAIYTEWSDSTGHG